MNRTFRSLVIALAMLAGITAPTSAQVIAPLDLSCGSVAQTRMTTGGHYLLCTTVGRYCPDRELLDALVACKLVDPEEAYKALRDKSDAVLALEPTEWTLDVSRAPRSNFKLFGQVAADRPIGTIDTTVQKGAWAAELLVIRGLSDRDSGDPADYYDGIISRLWEKGNFSGSFDLELFYAPSQRGTPSATFMSPMGTVTWAPNDHFSVKVGTQYVSTHNTDYSGGDRLYGWLEPKVATSIGRVSVSGAVGFVAANTGRTTVYFDGNLEFPIAKSLNLYVSYLEAKSRGTGVPGVVPIDGTVTLGANTSF